MPFKLQSARYGQDWQDEIVTFPIDIDLDDVNVWIAKCRSQEDFDGRYHWRVVLIEDDNEMVVYGYIPPFESLKINPFGNKAAMLEEIRQNYGVDASIWGDACREWLAQNS